MAIRPILLAIVILACACGSDDDPSDTSDAADAAPDASPGVALCGALPASCGLDCEMEPGADVCAQQPYPQTPDCDEFCYEGRCCTCEDAAGSGPEWKPSSIDCDPGQESPECPNYIASDETCGDCTKAWGSGASYCADTCTTNDDCDGRANPWASDGVALVCHPRGYCTRPCAGDEDCTLTAHDAYVCDPAGACSFCVDCF